MAFDIKTIMYNLPEVRKPVEKKISFNTKLKWTLIVLVSFFILANITLYGLSKNALEQFQFLQVIFATELGSIFSLGTSRRKKIFSGVAEIRSYLLHNL